MHEACKLDNVLLFYRDRILNWELDKTGCNSNYLFESLLWFKTLNKQRASHSFNRIKENE